MCIYVSSYIFPLNWINYKIINNPSYITRNKLFQLANEEIRLDYLDNLSSLLKTQYNNQLQSDDESGR